MQTQYFSLSRGFLLFTQWGLFAEGKSHRSILTGYNIEAIESNK